MKKIVIAIDSFKGCLSSAAIAKAVARGIWSVLPHCEVVQLPIADGGEGTVDALVAATGGTYISPIVQNPLGQPIAARYGILGNGRQAVIEMAAASGLALIPSRSGQVMHCTTFGTGQLIADAIHRGCRDFLLGIGGSATNEAGIGLLQALGFQFWDAQGRPLPPTGEGLCQLASIHTEGALPELSACHFHLLTDVQNPLYGPNGAAHIFATQKGATPDQVEQLDQALQRFAQLVQQQTNRNINQPGAGAGGGMAGGCMAFLPATVESGIEVVKQALQFDEVIQGADLILTGEGKVDQQTRQGKVIAGVLKSARVQQIPVVALTGNCLDYDPQLSSDGLTALFPIHPAPLTLTEALDPTFAAQQLERTTQQIIAMLNVFNC